MYIYQKEDSAQLDLVCDFVKKKGLEDGKYYCSNMYHRGDTNAMCTHIFARATEVRTQGQLERTTLVTKQRYCWDSEHSESPSGKL